jgi:hypothetical protein
MLFDQSAIIKKQENWSKMGSVCGIVLAFSSQNGWQKELSHNLPAEKI